MDAKLIKLAERFMELLTLALIVVVAVRNWNLTRRVRRLEGSLGVQVKPQRVGIRLL
jgi:hypothetical protein